MTSVLVGGTIPWSWLAGDADAGHQLVIVFVIAAIGKLVQRQIHRLLEFAQRFHEMRLVVGGIARQLVSQY